MAVGGESSSKAEVNEPEDCLGCRLVGGGGCLGASAYMAYHASRNTNRVGRLLTFVFAGGKFLATLGFDMVDQLSFAKHIHETVPGYWLKPVSQGLSALGGIGITRLLKLPPFDKGKHRNTITS